VLHSEGGFSGSEHLIPAGQGSHLFLPPWSLKLPGSQGVQIDADRWPVALTDAFPAGQGEQAIPFLDAAI
jgi:hypothetical protein